jgi:hypothetical protein
MSEDRIAQYSALIDTLIVLISAMSTNVPAIIAGVVLLAARRWPLFARGVLSWAGVSLPLPAWVRVVLPGAGRLDMSTPAAGEGGSREAGTGSEPAEPEVVPGLGNQAEPAFPEEYDIEFAATTLQNNADLFIAVLAEMRTADGGYRFSANQIVGFVGGRAAEVKAKIAARRPKAESAPAQPSGPAIFRDMATGARVPPTYPVSGRTAESA